MIFLVRTRRDQIFTGFATGPIILPDGTPDVKVFDLDFGDQFSWSFALVGGLPGLTGETCIGAGFATSGVIIRDGAGDVKGT
jgi:hypothetical protein